MIALETTAKIGKSPKKPQVELREESDEDEEESEEESANESVAGELESADEGMEENESENGDLDAESENSDGESNTENGSKATGNPGWADVMQKILKTKKPKRKKTVVLSKAKKLCDVVKKEKEEELPFEIDGVKQEVKTEESAGTGDSKPIVPAKHRRKDNLGIRVKPSIADRERERMLQRIATKGVVQLFNAVKQQQMEINKKLTEAGPLERKRDQVLKSIDKKAFLDVLMGGTKSILVDNEVKDETQDSSKDVNKKKDDKVWSVLREDFGMGAKLKDWDRKDDEEDSSAPEDMDSDE